MPRARNGTSLINDITRSAGQVLHVPLVVRYGNLQTLTVYPNDDEFTGNGDFDRVAMAYDGLSRPRTKTDQLGDTGKTKGRY